MKTRVVRWMGLAAAAGCILAVPLAAQPEQRQPGLRFVPIRIESSAEALPQTRKAALDKLAAQQPEPQHVVVMIHGYDTNFDQSQDEYDRMAADIHREFKERGERVAVLGAQWPSDAGALREWLPRSVAHLTLSKLGVFKKAVKDPYKQRVLMSYSVGRRGFRQILLDVKDRFPKAKLHVFAHSLGSEIALQAIEPRAAGPDGTTEPAYKPERALNVDLLALCGADLDQDRALPVRREGGGSSELLWITVPERGGKRDRVLMLRKLTRGQAAVGEAAPRLAEKDLDALISNRRLIFDTRNIPPGHALLDYFDPERISDLADAAAELRTPGSGRSSLLKLVDMMLKEPADSPALRAALESPDASVRLYAMWRLEQAYCGSSAHLVDGSAMKLALSALHKPKELEKTREKAACTAFKTGYGTVTALAPEALPEAPAP